MKNSIKIFITKLPVLSLVVISAVIFRIGAIGVMAANKAQASADRPIYTVVFDAFMGDNSLHGSTNTAAKDNPSKKDKEETYTKSDDADAKSDEHIEPEGGTLPEDSSRPVVQAVDYGIANSDYMDEDGTTYDYINDGIFSFHSEMRTFEKVEDDYFYDALIIGDSRSDGLYRYGDIRESANFFALESITIYNLFEVSIPFHEVGKEDVETTLEDVLSTHTFKKIYLAPGMNELGVPDTSGFRQEYINAIERIRQLQPDAIIYIEGIIHVNIDRSATDDVFNNKNIVQRNEAISKLANGYDIFYIDPNEVLCDDNGNLIYEYTNDGVHLTARYYPLWHDYMKEYAINTD